MIARGSVYRHRAYGLTGTAGCSPQPLYSRRRANWVLFSIIETACWVANMITGIRSFCFATEGKRTCQM